MRTEDIASVVSLQRQAFPPPFDPELLWQPEHLQAHVDKFPAGQMVAERDGAVVGSCSNTIIDEEHWQAKGSWNDTVGGPFLETFTTQGGTLYGLDISVHPNARRKGIGRAFYEARFALVRQLGLARYGTACRVPDFQKQSAADPSLTPERYVGRVESGDLHDRTLTPLLRYGLDLKGVILGYMEDPESGDVAAVLEWRP